MAVDGETWLHNGDYVAVRNQHSFWVAQLLESTSLDDPDKSVRVRWFVLKRTPAYPGVVVVLFVIRRSVGRSIGWSLPLISLAGRYCAMNWVDNVDVGAMHPEALAIDPVTRRTFALFWFDVLLIPFQSHFGRHSKKKGLSCCAIPASCVS
jgi:hypothetical protein